VRAHEFIVEGKRSVQRAEPRHEFEMAHPGLVGPAANNDIYWGRYYDFYRVCSLAGMDPKELDKVADINFFGNLPLFSAYTDYDRDKLKAIMKKLGMKPEDTIDKGSYESNGTNTNSPVKSFQGYNK
jgi:hypothetical protein